MEANFNLGSLKIVQNHLTDYLKSSSENIASNINLITVEKKHPTDFVAIELLGKAQRTLEMIGLNGLGSVLKLIEIALNKVKSVEYDTKNSVEVLQKCEVLVDSSLSYINRLVTSGVDQPTVFFDKYSDLANKISVGSNIKDLFFPKLEFKSDISVDIKKDFKNSIVITEETKKSLLDKIDPLYKEVQDVIPALVKVFDNFGSFNSEEAEKEYVKNANQLKDNFKELQSLRVNKGYFCLFGIYQLYLSVINPVENPQYRKIVADNSENITLDLIQIERTLARLIQGISSMEIGEKTSSLLVDDLSVKDLIFDLCYFINSFPDVRKNSDFSILTNYFDIDNYISQLFNVTSEASVISKAAVADIVKLFSQSKDFYNTLSSIDAESKDFKIVNSKFIADFRKLNIQSSKLPIFNSLINKVLVTAEAVQEGSVIFTEHLKTELSVALVALDFAINNYLKNELFENLNKDFSKEVSLILERISLAVENDISSLMNLKQPQLDNLNLQLQEEESFSHLFTQIQPDIDKIEDVLDYFLRNDAENIDEVSSILKPLTNLKGVFAVVGDYELIGIIDTIINVWKNVTEDNKISEVQVKQSISLLSGLSLLVKAYSNGNLVEAEELQSSLLKIFYKDHSDLVPKREVNVNVDSILVDNTFSNQSNEEKIAHEATKDDALDFDLSVDINSFNSNPKVEEINISVNSDCNVKNDAVGDSINFTAIETSSEQSYDFVESTNDPEIAEVFFMEADEVLEGLDNELDKLSKDLSNKETLTDVRRMFHTLKGSGRMVGLEYMGELAWMVEQTLNKCLNNELELSEEIIEFSRYTGDIFRSGIESLKLNNKADVPLIIVKEKALKINPGLTNHVDIPTAELVDSEEVQVIESSLSSEEVPVVEELTMLSLDENSEEQDLLPFAEEKPTAHNIINNNENSSEQTIELVLETSSDESKVTETVEETSYEVPEQFAEINFEICDNNEVCVETPVSDESNELEVAAIPNDIFVSEPVVSQFDHSAEIVSEQTNFSDEGGIESNDISNHINSDMGEIVEVNISIEDVSSPEDYLIEKEQTKANTVDIDGVAISKVLYDLFIEESSEHISSLKEFANSNFDENLLVKEEDMRHAHTLSSIAASVNMSLVSELSSKLEDILQFCLDNTVPLTQANLTPIRHAVENLDLLRTSDSSAYISYCDGLIESLNSLHENLIESMTDKTTSNGGNQSSIDIEQLGLVMMEKINALINSQHTDLINILEERNSSLTEKVSELSEKIVVLENNINEYRKRSEEKELNLSKALEVAKNDIRVMANIVKKKSERIEALSNKEDIQSEIVDDSEVDYLIDGSNLSNDQLDAALNNFVDDNIPDDNLVNSVILKYPHLNVIFEDKVSSITDEIEDELYELSKLENEDLLVKVYTILDHIDENGLNKSEITEFKRYLHTIKGGSRMAGANKVGMIMHRLETLMDYIESNSINIWDFKPIILNELSKVTFLSTNDSNNLKLDQKKWLDNIAGSTSEDVTDNLQFVGSTKDIQQFIRVPTNVVDSAITEAGEIRLTRTSLENINNNNKKSVIELKSSSDKLLKMVKEVEIQAESQIKARKDSLDTTSSDFDPLEFDRFTRLQELTRFMNETVLDIHESIVGLESTVKVQDATVSQQSVVSNNLLTELMKVRLVPFDTIVDRFYKIARNTSKELSKKVTLEIYGEKTELDKIILDKIISPIEHLMRNSIAHGIELPEDRLVSGKNQSGTIGLKIEQEGNSTIISISDDGAGINLDKVRSIAISKGMISEGDELTKDEIINLIFQSGFSTADTISQVSGRGVGMDVVKSEITSLGGTVKVITNEGLGSTFILSIPMSIATNQCVLAYVRNKLIAIPAVLVESIGSIKEKVITEAYNREILSINGKDYDFIYAGHLLGLVEQNVSPEVKTYNNYMMIRYVDENIIIHVDKVVTTSEVLIKSLGIQYGKIDGILGATILGDGTQGLVVNPVLLKKYYKNVLSNVVNINIDSGAGKKAQHRTTVMVVDDSITVRRATTKVLERNNFSVITAKDGEDALEQLQVSVPDVILSDIEMPRMDGFEFVKNVRNIDKFNKIPIIMITSRTADKHKSYAYELGANDFLGKPYKEEDLVEKINLLFEEFKEKF